MQFEKHVQTVMQALILAGIFWLFNTTETLQIRAAEQGADLKGLRELIANARVHDLARIERLERVLQTHLDQHQKGAVQ